MGKVTSKRQLTLPKAIADQYGIRPGDELEWIPAGETIRVGRVRRDARTSRELTGEDRLALFDQDTVWLDRIQSARLKKSARARRRGAAGSQGRGWTREELSTRGFPR